MNSFKSLRLLLLALSLVDSSFAIALKTQGAPSEQSAEIEADAEFEDYTESRVKYALGISVFQNSFKVSEIDNPDLSGQFDSYMVLPYFAMRSKDYHLFGDYSWYLEIGFGVMKYSRQEAALDHSDLTIDVGTKIRGGYAYIIPTPYHSWKGEKTGRDYRLGLGVGIAYLKAKGNIKIPDVDIDYSNAELVEFSKNGVTLGAGVMFELVEGPMLYRISVFGPVVEDKNHSFSAFEVKGSIAYLFNSLF